MPLQFELQLGDVTHVASDLLVLKYAQTFYGADGTVADLLVSRGICREDSLRPRPGEHVIIETDGVIAPARVLFLGVPNLGRFRYAQMRQFARRAMEIAADERARTITTTVHGTGYGLDVEESLAALVGGFREGAVGPGVPGRVTFVEFKHRRAQMLLEALSQVPPPPAPASNTEISRRSPNTGPKTVTIPPAPPRRHVFVAMPFSEEFEDVYQFGIYATVRKCGYVCEKVDVTVYTGDIVQRIREGIEAADFVVAELTGERPNVYLEVGYAWGLNRPVIMIARDGTRLHFDLSHHKCIFYKTIGRLADELERSIRTLTAGAGTPHAFEDTPPG